jgi:hypothetical protein
MQALYLGRKLEVIKIDGEEALIAYGGSDRTFLKTSDLEFIGQPPPTKETPEVEPMELVEPASPKSRKPKPKEQEHDN